MQPCVNDISVFVTKKDVPKMSLHMVIMIYVTKLCKLLSLENLIAYQILRLISNHDILKFNRFKFMINYIISWNDFISYYTSLIETNRMSLPRGVWRRNEVKCTHGSSKIILTYRTTCFDLMLPLSIIILKLLPFDERKTVSNVGKCQSHVDI